MIKASATTDAAPCFIISECDFIKPVTMVRASSSDILAGKESMAMLIQEHPVRCKERRCCACAIPDLCLCLKHEVERRLGRTPEM
jgi:hypothetical protein